MKFPELESSTIEWKREIPKNEQIIKTIVGFCNQNGGKLIVGVDNDGSIIGISEDEIQRMLEYLDKSIHEATAPPIIPLVYTQRFGAKIVFIIEVSAGMNKPYYIKSEGLENGVYIRLGRSTVRANTQMIEELRWQTRGREFDMMPVHHAQKEHLDEMKINEFLRARIRKKEITTSLKDAMHSYHLLVFEHAHHYPTVAGILLFGKNTHYFFEHAIILCSHFSGTEGREAIASKECSGTIIDQYHEAYDFILSRLNYSFTIKGKVRSEVLEVPEVAVREILVNALVHRNYNIKAPIKVAIYQDRIEIYSPGCFPGPLDVKTLRMGFTFMRNVAICKVFRELGLIENMGTGIEAVFSSYEQRGLKLPEINEDKNYVKCILPRTPMSKMNELFLHPGVSSEDNDILNLLNKKSHISISDVVNELGLARSTAGRRLAILVEKGFLCKRGVGKATKYLSVQQKKLL